MIINIRMLNFNIIWNKYENSILFCCLNGDWGLGIGDWGLGIGPNPQSPKLCCIRKYKIMFFKLNKIK